VFDRLLPHVGRDGTCDETKVRVSGRVASSDDEEWKRRTIESLMDVSSKTHVVGHDVEHSNHLRKDEDSMSIGLELDEKLVEENHLSGVHHDSSKNLGVDVRLDLGSFEEVGVIPGEKCGGG